MKITLSLVVYILRLMHLRFWCIVELGFKNVKDKRLCTLMYAHPAHVIKRGSRVVDIPYEINVDHPPIIAHSKLIKAQPLFPSQTKPDRNRIPNVIWSHFPLGRSHWCINSSGGFLFIRFNLQLSHCKDCSSVREALDLGFPPSAPNLALMVLLMDKNKVFHNSMQRLRHPI